MENFIDKFKYILIHKAGMPKGYKIKDGFKYRKVWIVDKKGRRTTVWKKIDDLPKEPKAKKSPSAQAEKKTPKADPKKSKAPKSEPPKPKPKNKKPESITASELKPEIFKTKKADKTLFAFVNQDTLEKAESKFGLGRNKLALNFKKEYDNLFPETDLKNIKSKERYHKLWGVYLNFLTNMSSFMNGSKKPSNEFEKHLLDKYSHQADHGIIKPKQSKLNKNRFKEYKSGDKDLLTSREDITVLPKTEYTEGGKALPHQVDTVNLAMENFSKGNKSFLIADGTGAGKTITSLTTALAFLKNQQMQSKHNNKPIIIVTESDAIIDNAWFGDAKKLGMEHLLVNGKTDGLFHPGKIVVTTYSQISKVKNLSNTDHKPGLVIFDESHNLKNSKGQRAKDAFEVIDNVSHCLMATATPVDKVKHIEYICRANQIDYNAVKDAIKVNSRKLPKANRKDMKNYLEALNLSSLFDDFTRKGLMVKREVSLKNIDFETQEVGLNENQEEAVDTMLEAYLQGKAKGEKSGLMNFRRGLEKFKMKHTMDLVQKEIKAGRQVVIFAENVGDFNKLGSNTEGTLPMIKKQLEKLGIPHDSIFGGSPTKADRKKNKKAMENFQSGASKVIFGNIASMGTGISLDDQTGKAPRTMIIMTPPFSAMGFTQAIGRISRLQTKSRAKVILPFVSGKARFVDMWMNGILTNKIRALGASVKGDISEIDLYGDSVPSTPMKGNPININDYKISNSEKMSFSKSNIWGHFFKYLENKLST